MLSQVSFTVRKTLSYSWDSKWHGFSQSWNKTKLQYPRRVAELFVTNCVNSMKQSLCHIFRLFCSVETGWETNNREQYKPNRTSEWLFHPYWAQKAQKAEAFVLREKNQRSNLWRHQHLLHGFNINKRCKCIMLSRISYTVSSATVKANSEHCTGVREEIIIF